MCLLVTTMSCANTTELIEMLCGMWTRVVPRNHVLGVAQIPPRERAFFVGGIYWPIVKYGVSRSYSVAAVMHLFAVSTAAAW